MGRGRGASDRRLRDDVLVVERLQCRDGMRSKRVVKLLRTIRRRQARIDRALLRVLEALGEGSWPPAPRKRASYGRSRQREESTSESERTDPAGPYFRRVGSAEPSESETSHDSAIEYSERRDERSGRSLGVWIYRRDSDDRPTESMCVVAGQAVLIRMEDGSDSPALVKVVDEKEAVVVWPELLEGSEEACEAGDAVPIESVQGEPCFDAHMCGAAWNRNACRSIAHPRCWLVAGDAEVGSYVPWGWSSYDRRTRSVATMPPLLRDLWTSVLQPALAMGVEVRADREMKGAVESHLLSPLRELRVVELNSRGTECELCRRNCSRRIYRLSFTRHDPATIFSLHVGCTCAAACALAYECVSLLHGEMGYAPKLGDPRFEFCHRRSDLLRDDARSVIELFSGRILSTRGGDRCNLREDDTDFDLVTYLTEF